MRAALAGVAISTGCNALLGLEVGDLAGAGGASSTGAGGKSSSGTGGGTIAQGGSDGGAACGPSQNTCAGTCASASDPSFGCGAASCAPCAVAHATATCSNDGCAVGKCDDGFEDCNGKPADGCEADLQFGGATCGTCDTVCSGGTACRSGACVASDCQPGEGSVLGVLVSDLDTGLWTESPAGGPYFKQIATDDGDATYLWDDSASVSLAMFGAQFSLPSGRSVTRVVALARARVDAAPASLWLALRVDAGNALGFHQSVLLTAYTDFVESYEQNPISNAPWAAADFASIGVGVASTRPAQPAPLRVTYFSVEVCLAPP